MAPRSSPARRRGPPYAKAAIAPIRGPRRHANRFPTAALDLLQGSLAGPKTAARKSSRLPRQPSGAPLPVPRQVCSWRGGSLHAAAPSCVVLQTNARGDRRLAVPGPREGEGLLPEANAVVANG